MSPPIERPPQLNEESQVETISNVSHDGKRWFRDSRVIPCLISTILHTVMLILLAAVTLPSSAVSSFLLTIKQVPAQETVHIEQMPSEETMIQANDLPADQQVNVNLVPDPARLIHVEAPSESKTAAPLPTFSATFSADKANQTQLLTVHFPSGGGLSARNPEGRKEFGERYGATTESEAAVEKALAWLAAHQRPNGSWSFNLEHAPCSGRCSHSKIASDMATPSTGATGLALLAFLGAGYTHTEGKYQKVVNDGLYYLRGAAVEATSGIDWQQGSMYGHGIAMMAVAESLAMSRTKENEKGDADLRDLVEDATWFTTYAQHKNGSWGYSPGKFGDTTQTGWQVLSLIAARRSKVPISYHILPKARDYILSTRLDESYSFAYQKGERQDPTNTAIGLTLMLYLGKTPYDLQMSRALDDLSNRGPKLTNVYHDYYGTLALHHSRHSNWTQWNKKVRDHLVRTQASSGHEAGSWHFKDEFGDVGGRLYTTAMSAMILEIYYRYLPLYGDMETFPL